MQSFEEKDLKLKHPCTILVAGPRRSGKSEFTKQLILQSAQLFDEDIDTFIWYYSGALQSELFDSLSKKVNFIQGLPDYNIEECFSGNVATLLVFDDLMYEASSRADIKSLFTRGRHRNLSVVFLSQNLFHQGKHSREMSLNSDYMVLFKNPRDTNIVTNLARQMNNVKFVKWAYNDATSHKPFSYLFVDLRQDTPDILRFRTDILNPISAVYVNTV